MSQRVLITAGASGIGRDMARAFATNGAKVFVCDEIDEVRAHPPYVRGRGRPQLHLSLHCRHPRPRW